MKTIIKYFFTSVTALLLFAACSKDATLTYLDVVSFPPALTASASSITMSPDNLDSSVITFSWPSVTFKVQAPVTYTLQMTVPSDTIGSTAWGNAISVEIGSDVLSKSYNGSDLNTIALNQLGFMADSASTMVARVMATLDRNIFSNTVAFDIIPYKSTELKKLWVPGDYENWDPASAAVIAEKAGRDNLYEGYVYMDGSGTKGFKYTNAPDWNNTNYGDGGNGVLSTDGNAGNLTVSDGGYYELTADLNTNKWTATKTTWGIIGDATPNGWDADTQMEYDATNQVWTVTVDMSASGSFKFRANNEWVIDFGIDSNGTLTYADNPFFGYTDGINNLTVPESGNYTITLDLHNAGNYTYTLLKN